MCRHRLWRWAVFRLCPVRPLSSLFQLQWTALWPRPWLASLSWLAFFPCRWRPGGGEPCRPCACCLLVFRKCIANGRDATLVAHCLLPPCLLQRYDNHACHAISRGVKIYANGCIRRCRRGCYVAAGCPVELACISACGAGLCRGWRRRPAKRAVWGGRTARFAAWRGRFAGRGRRAGPPDKHRVLKRTGSQGVGEQWHYSMNCFRS